MIVTYDVEDRFAKKVKAWVHVQINEKMTGMYLGMRSSARLYAGLEVALNRAMSRCERGKCLKCGCEVTYPGGIRHPDPKCGGVLVPYP